MVEYSKSEEIVAHYIVDHFLGSELEIEDNETNTIFKINFESITLIIIDKVGANFAFPTKGNPSMKWSGISEGSPESVGRMILRYLGDAGYVVDSHSKRSAHSKSVNPEIQKRD